MHDELIQRAEALANQMTSEELSSQMIHEAPAIPRLRVPTYNWWNECLHGVGRAGIATVFPQAIGLSAMWDTARMFQIATVISDEARAKHHEAVRQGDRGWYRGLTFWSPNINIFRDPRWGRGQETYGEDPWLTARMGVAFVKGLQGEHPKWLKLVATPKHYAVHSGPEGLRHAFDARVSPQDLWATYLPAFEACVREARAASVMGAYNRTNGEACCASPTLLQRILRETWGFDGYVVSDCGAIADIHAHHRLAPDAAAASAMAVRAGCDLECGCEYAWLKQALSEGLLTEADMRRSVTRLMHARLRLGMLEPEDPTPWGKIPYEVVGCADHRYAAREAARASIVLLRNGNPGLPLPEDVRVAVIGPNAHRPESLVGNYNGTPCLPVTPLEGIVRRLGGSRVRYAEGCAPASEDRHGFSEAVSAAMRADVTVLCLGLTPQLEGEEGDAYNADASGDRLRLGLPGAQEALLQTLLDCNTPVVLVLLNGGPITLPAAAERCAAVVELWYPGEEGGNALADVLFGTVNPAGRMPVTTVAALDHLPAFEDYSMDGRTYRYARHTPQTPFGFGLSYTSFAYRNLKAPDRLACGDPLALGFQVHNSGAYDGEEVIQVYASRSVPGVRLPIRELVSFLRVTVPAGGVRDVAVVLEPQQLGYVDPSGERVTPPGEVTLSIGGSQGDARSLALGAAPVLKHRLLLQ